VIQITRWISWARERRFDETSLLREMADTLEVALSLANTSALVEIWIDPSLPFVTLIERDDEIRITQFFPVVFEAPIEEFLSMMGVFTVPQEIAEFLSRERARVVLWMKYNQVLLMRIIRWQAPLVISEEGQEQKSIPEISPDHFIFAFAQAGVQIEWLEVDQEMMYELFSSLIADTLGEE